MQQLVASGTGAGASRGGEGGAEEPAGSGGVEIQVVNEGGIGQTRRTQFVLHSFHSVFGNVNLAATEEHSEVRPLQLACVAWVCNETQTAQCCLGSQLPLLSLHYLGESQVEVNNFRRTKRGLIWS